MHVRGWRWRRWSSVWGVFGVGNEDTKTSPLVSCRCLYCRLWVWLEPCFGVCVVDFGQVNAGWVIEILMTRFLLTNDIFDWLIYFVVTFCSVRLFFTVHFTDFNNYLIYIMKLQVFIVLWSVLKSPLVLGSRFVATSHFICIAGWLAGFCMMRVFGWLGFSNIGILVLKLFVQLPTALKSNTNDTLTDCLFNQGYKWDRYSLKTELACFTSLLLETLLVFFKEKSSFFSLSRY